MYLTIALAFCSKTAIGCLVSLSMLPRSLRGTVSDDILRMQTGHSDEKMTDHYDHMTDERGEQLRKAVQGKILTFISKGVAGQ